MLERRAAGVLLHLTALPGPHGIGDLGAPARAFVDWLAAAGQSLWQVLPLNPPGGGNSPYDASSAFAGNTWLISLTDLVADDLLGDDELADVPTFAEDEVLFDEVHAWKLPLLHAAADRLLARACDPALVAAFERFVEMEHAWLEPYVDFLALREHHGGRARDEWPIEDRIAATATQPGSDASLRARGRERALQFLFDRQLTALTAYARAHGVELFGDVPIFVGSNSADVWSHPALFALDETHLPAIITGASPDEFSDLGQVWGMPAYDWTAMAADQYEWWIQRLAHVFRHFGVVRVDHFRGFADWWALPPDAEDARPGTWAPGPGRPFFDEVERRLGRLNLIAEDLGFHTEPFLALFDELGLPGMKVLQSGFREGPSSLHLPHNHRRNAVVYSSTHDTDTVHGWAARLPEAVEGQGTIDYLGCGFEDAADQVMRRTMQSVSALAIIPIQDWAGLGSGARFNTPGTATGNWKWRARASHITDELAERVRAMSAASYR